ncbi:Integrase catalytic domain-containing protein [Aphis craccivora]|uniref:Integrase catalytic domain-containing protein n=1 Tax=Aphis craccivora TaxID=307492 RepID=A0A6G0WYN1_APHCR|nr:Integrase catalytic domain-containing protein [Aphis craccivora]
MFVDVIILSDILQRRFDWSSLLELSTRKSLDAVSISSSQLWWSGPIWLSNEHTPSLAWISYSYSNWMKLLRITALIKLFTDNCFPISRQRKQKIFFFIRSEELQSAKHHLKTQFETFPDEITALKQLNHFIDTLGLIRVDGRHANAPIAESKKCPIVHPFKRRSVAKQTVSRCIQCFRTRPKFIPLFMAPLPRERVTIERTFSNVD